MNKTESQQRKSLGLIGTIFGSLIVSLPIATQEANAQTQIIVSCPGIYYEEPYNSRLLVPEGCPPNAYTEQQELSVTAEGVEPLPGTPNEPVAPLPGTPLPGTPDEPVAPLPGDAETSGSVPPLPEERSEPIAYVEPTEGTISVKLVNQTNASINYEAVTYTQRREIAGGEEVMLKDLPVPVTITAVREDNGLLNLVATSSESGMLEIVMEEDPTFDDTQGVLRIQEDGQVFVN